jgi:prepilin-type N-terminal cleavage/methylation domain-containing protein
MTHRTAGSPRACGQDHGFTLIELLVVVAILAAIAAPLANVIIGYVRNAGATTDRLELSHDAQVAAAYFARDVSAVGLHDPTNLIDKDNKLVFKPSIQVDAAFNEGGYVCGDASTPNAIIRLLSDDFVPATKAAPASTEIVAYYLRPGGAVSELHRKRCGSDGMSDIVVAHFIDASIAYQPACSSDCESSTVPAWVSLTLSVRPAVLPPSGAAVPSAGSYTIVLVGQRRQI